MAYLAHHATLAKSSGTATVRDTYEVEVARARRKHGAQSREYRLWVQRLEGPDFPESLRYLKAWSDDLYGRCGVSMDGVAPLDWPSVDAWARRMQVDPEPHEFDALFALDAVRRHPPEDAE